MKRDILILLGAAVVGYMAAAQLTPYQPFTFAFQQGAKVA